MPLDLETVLLIMLHDNTVNHCRFLDIVGTKYWNAISYLITIIQYVRHFYTAINSLVPTSKVIAKNEASSIFLGRSII